MLALLFLVTDKTTTKDNLAIWEKKVSLHVVFFHCDIYVLR